jgi:hypothetical protein
MCPSTSSAALLPSNFASQKMRTKDEDTHIAVWGHIYALILLYMCPRTSSAALLPSTFASQKMRTKDEDTYIAVWGHIYALILLYMCPSTSSAALLPSSFAIHSRTCPGSYEDTYRSMRTHMLWHVVVWRHIYSRMRTFAMPSRTCLEILLSSKLVVFIMYVCMYVCMYVSMYVCMYVYI